MSPKEKAEWLASLNPGDEVAVVSATTVYICKVERRYGNTIQVVLPGDRKRKFDATAGFIVHSEMYGHWDCYRLEPPTETLTQQANRQEFWRLIEWLHHRGPLDKERWPQSVIEDVLCIFDQLPKEFRRDG